MDGIFVPIPFEDLTVPQISLVNRLRMHRLSVPGGAGVNEAVKRGFARALTLGAPAQVLDWGCGFTSMQEYLPEAGDVGLDLLDVDPQVVAYQRRRGRTCWCARTDDIPPRTYEAIVSVFVWHFPVSAADIDAMAGSLAPGGFILANVYRRGRESRRAFAERFLERGFELVVRRDPFDLCRDHEYWALSLSKSDRFLSMLTDECIAGSAGTARAGDRLVPPR